MKEVYGSMALDTERLYTTKDIMALPEGARAELIDGKIYYMATPTVITFEDVIPVGIAEGFSIDFKTLDY